MGSDYTIEVNKNSDFTVEQFTGLYAVDGYEIYEGDIVKVMEKNLAKVVWESGAFAAILLAPEGTLALHWLYKLYTPTDISVIGTLNEMKGISLESQLNRLEHSPVTREVAGSTPVDSVKLVIITK